MFLSILEKLFTTRNHDGGHGFEHALNVMGHSYKMCKEANLSPKVTNEILIASGCHDINDSKFNNAFIDLNVFLKDIDVDKDIVIKMVDLVSCSRNGDSYVEPTWLLIPRYADRLEAVGKVGFERAILYGRYIGRPYQDDDTVEVYDIERYHKYCKGLSKSKTTIDHIYDKVIYIECPEWFNFKYAQGVFKIRQKELARLLSNEQRL